MESRESDILILLFFFFFFKPLEPTFVLSLHKPGDLLSHRLAFPSSSAVSVVGAEARRKTKGERKER
jgi:hypothetical protein